MAPPPMGRAALALQDRLEALGSASAVVPVRAGGKTPMFKHRGNAWTVEDSRAWFAAPPRWKFSVGILVESELWLDFDDVLRFAKLRARFPELGRAPTETTRRGVHVMLRRTEAVDAAGITDGPLVDRATGTPLKIDVKTRTGSKVDGVYTRGLIVVAPSSGREWRPDLSVFDVDPPEPSAALIDWIVSHFARSRHACAGGRAPRKAAAKGGAAAAGPKKEEKEVAAEAAVTLEWNLAGGLGARLPAELGGGLFIKPAIADLDMKDVQRKLTGAVENLSRWPRTYGASFGVSFKNKGRCPACGKGAHNNQYKLFHGPGGRRWLHNHSGSCSAKISIAYTGPTAAAYTEQFRVVAGAAFRVVPPSPGLSAALSSALWRTSAGEGALMRAWWDDEARVLYAELERRGKAWFCALGLDRPPNGEDWTTPTLPVLARVTQMPHCFADPESVEKAYVDTGDVVEVVALLA